MWYQFVACVILAAAVMDTVESTRPLDGRGNDEPMRLSDDDEGQHTARLGFLRARKTKTVDVNERSPSLDRDEDMHPPLTKDRIVKKVKPIVLNGYTMDINIRKFKVWV